MSETLSSDVPAGFYHGFYTYLYLGSLGFLIFNYMEQVWLGQSNLQIVLESQLKID